MGNMGSTYDGSPGTNYVVNAGVACTDIQSDEYSVEPENFPRIPLSLSIKYIIFCNLS
jgi:hypothetical protein